MSDTTTTPSSTLARVTLPEIVEIVRPIVETVVWSIVATVGPDGRPRTRLLHPVWSWGDGTDAPVGVVTARPTPLKRRHLAHQPVMSCAYWSPAQDAVYLDCDATWMPLDEREAAWALLRETPEPVGFDPATIWPGGPGSADFTPITLRPYRIRAVTLANLTAGAPHPIWSR